MSENRKLKQCTFCIRILYGANYRTDLPTLCTLNTTRDVTRLHCLDLDITRRSSTIILLFSILKGVFKLFTCWCRRETKELKNCENVKYFPVRSE
jgi:hypothetical protein